MKNIFKSKAFPAAMLSVACIGILAACWAVSRDNAPGFTPEGSAPEASIHEWTETPPAAKEQTDASSADTEKTVSAYAPAQPQPADEGMEAYPKVTEETEQLVTIDFTPEAEKLQPEPPAPPVAEGGTDDPEQPPVYAPEALEPEPTAAPAQPDTPAAGATNGSGAVYDPVFGWVVPGNVSQTPMDSAGDPDKMVGNM